METSLQRIQKTVNSEFDIARKYYSILFELNSLKITPTELDLIAFSAVKGTISTPPVRDEFIEKFKVPKGYIYNMVSKLQKLQIFVKDEKRKVRINPLILPDFTKEELLLVIKIHNNGNNSTGDLHS